MHKIFIVCATGLVLAGCVSAKREAFDPGIDPRIGAEVDKACFSGTASTSGGYRQIGDRDAFVTGAMRQKYLLLFSRGCGRLGPIGSFPVFRDYGDHCRRKGEIVQTAESGIGVTGGCAIERIYEWDEGAADEGESSDDS